MYYNESYVMARPSRNMTDVERAIRVGIGAVALPLAIVWLVLPASGALAVLLWAVVVVAALDLVVSGAVGHCPLYRHVNVPWGPRERRT